MRYRLHLFTAAVLAAVAIGGPVRSQAAELSDRAAEVGRQKIRTELAEALSDGHISRKDQYRILLDAKEVLRPEDLPGLERTLDRLASANESAPAASKKAPRHGRARNRRRADARRPGSGRAG